MTFNALFGLGPDHAAPDQACFGYWPLQDDAADLWVRDAAGGRDGLATFETRDRATAGPNTWLTKALDFQGNLGDNVTLNYGFPGGLIPNGDFAMLCRFKAANTAFEGTAFGRSNGTKVLDLYAGANDELIRTDYGAPPNVESLKRSGRDTGWHDCMFTMYNNGTAQLFVDGSAAEYGGTAPASFDDIATPMMIGARGGDGAKNWYGPLADVSYFTRALGSSEYQNEWRLGPEPVNSTLPTVGGYPVTGGLVTCNPGAWGLPAPFSTGTNGDVTYSYQWTRSDDEAGTGKADIAGATSQGYVPTAADQAKWLGCRVAASNTGGNDPASDRESSNRISVWNEGSGAALMVGLTG